METNKPVLSRRRFLQITGASAALASVGTLSFSKWSTEAAYAATPASDGRAPTLCNGCSNKCGLWINTKNGRITTVEGIEDHPFSKGTVCARGHGFAQFTYAKDRITEPLKKMDDGSFQAISWEQAFSEIGQQVKDIKSKYGAESIAFIRDPRPNVNYYGQRFINALGSANWYTHGASCNLSLTAGYNSVLGNSFSTDNGNAKMLMFIGRSYADGIRPSAVKGLADLAESKKAKIVMVDPRYNSSCRFADQWVPILPGNDLAFVLGMCNVLITENLYNHDFVDQYVTGFDEFKAEVAKFTPDWASKKCGVPAETIATLAREMAKAAPAAAIEPSWRAAFGCAHKNSFETARAVAAFNALLGNFGQKGGALMTGSPSLGKLDATKFPAVPKPEGKRVGDAEYPLTVAGMGSAVAALDAAMKGKLHAFFFCQSNAAKGYAQPKKWAEGLEKTDLVVTIDVQMSETCMLSDYVLPECGYLERMEVPELLGGKTYAVALRAPAVEIVHPNTKPLEDIIGGLAKACDVDKYFNFTIDELVKAQLDSINVSMDDLLKKGVVPLEGSTFAYGQVPKFGTTSGKIELTSEKVGKAGLNPTITWIEPKAQPASDEFYFVGGKQSIHCHTQSVNIGSLINVSKTYNLERLWINADDAAKLGISEGDTVEISSSEHTGKVGAHVTELLRPGVVYTPTHYGCTSPYLTNAYGYGICMPDFVPFDMEPGTGATMSEEVTVKIRKVGA